MKKFLLTIIIAASATLLHAQELAPDQNPNYKTSMDKYVAAQATTTNTMNTTVQNTYTAYDWSTAKAERKTELRNFRRECALFNNYNNGFYNNGYYNNNGGYFNNGFYNNQFYNNRYNNYRYRGCRRW